jgi:hypothetical protein
MATAAVRALIRDLSRIADCVDKGYEVTVREKQALAGNYTL